MTDSLELLRQAETLLSTVALLNRSTLSDDDVITLLTAEERIGRLIDASRVLSAAEVAERSRYDLGDAGLSMRIGERKADLLIEQVTRASHSEVVRRIRVGQAIRPRRSILGEELPPQRPIVAEAMTHGLIGVDTAHTILYSLKQAAGGSAATPEHMDSAERALVQLGTTDSADLVADAGRLWRDAMDPDGIEPRYEDILDRQQVTVGRERNGIKNYNVKAGPTLSAALDAALMDSMDPKVGPRFLDERDLARAERITEIIDGREVVTIVDPRSLERKRADILEGVLTAGLKATREGPTNLRTVGSVTAIISLKDLQAGTGFGILEGTDEVIPASIIQEMVCESGFNPVVLGNRGEPLYCGPRKRYATEAQRRALIARDGDRCISPGCKRRAAQTHAHHVIFHADGGPTDVDNLVLLCPSHHHALHQGAFELTMIDGTPHHRSRIDKFDPLAWQPVSRNRLLLTA